VRRQLTIAAFTVLACAALLGAVILAGNLARNSLQSSDRFQVSFDQIECLAPTGMDRETFLSDVRYYGEFPKTVSVLDESLRERLLVAFARHPWVEKVDGVEVGPGRQIRATLTFRTAILAVEYANPGPVTRVVDGSGILLPVAANAQGLPRLSGKGIPSPAAAGLPWGNAQVEGAARVAGLLHPHQSNLKLMQFRWQNGQLRLRGDSINAGPEVIWGRAPDVETNGEPSPESKLRHLLDQFDRPDSSADRAIIDLRKS
jgi:hypothetical protein